MKRINFLFVLLFCCVVHCAPPTSPGVHHAAENDTKDSSEVSIPANMNIADYYYSMFGKHLDYDYREPLITFGETENNNIDEVESEVDQNQDELMWNPHSRSKRFIIPVSPGVFNATRRWAQQARMLRMERRRLRYERRRLWRENRINYLNQRSESLRRQAELLSQRTLQQAQQRQQVTRTRSVPTERPASSRISLPVTSTSSVTTTAMPSSSSAADTFSASSPNQIPVKQVPIPEEAT